MFLFQLWKAIYDELKDQPGEKFWDKHSAAKAAKIIACDLIRAMSGEKGEAK